MEISMLINIFKMIKAIDDAEFSLEGLLKLKKDLLSFLSEDLEEQEELFNEFIKNRDNGFKDYRIKQELFLAEENLFKIDQEEQEKRVQLYYEMVDKMDEINRGYEELAGGQNDNK